MLYRVAVGFITIIIGAFSFIHSSSHSHALDGYRLCAMRQGNCSCQKLTDAPGIFTLMKRSICTGEPDVVNNIMGDEGPQSPFASPSLHTNPPIPTAANGDPYRLCAMRRGTCKCQKTGDDPGVLTPMEESYCGARLATIDDQQTNAPSVAKKPVASRKDIKDAQILLAQAGYNPGPADGVMGSKTRSAIKHFQGKSGLVSDGIPSSSVLTALRNAPAGENQIAVISPPAVDDVNRAIEPDLNSPAVTSPITPPTVTTPAPPQTSLALSGDVKLSNCALRSGKCTCKTPEDGPTQWTVVGSAQCKRTLFVNLWEKPATVIDATPQTIKGVQKDLNVLGYDAGRADGNLGMKTTTAITSFQNAVGMPVDGKITDILLQRLRDLAPDNVSEPVYANNTVSASVSSVPEEYSAATSTPAMTTPDTTMPDVNDEIISSASPETPISSLAAGPGTNFALPMSRDGYRLCASRKGKCQCQKHGDEPGAWTTMDVSVCSSL